MTRARTSDALSQLAIDQPKRRGFFLCVAGLASYIAWSYVFWNTPVLFGGSFQDASTSAAYLFQGVFTALAALLVALLAAHVDREWRRQALFGTCAACAVASVVVAGVAGTTQSGSLVTAALVASGIASTLRLFWEERLTVEGTKTVATGAASAYLVGFILYALVMLLPPMAISAACVLLPLASLALFVIAERQARKPNAPLAAHAEGKHGFTVSSVPAKYLVVVALVFFSYGATRISGIAGGFAAQSMGQTTLISGLPALASMVGILVAYLFHRRNPLLVFYVAIPVMAVAALFAHSTDPWVSGTVFGVMMLGTELLKYLVWFILVDTITKDAVSALMVLALLRFAQWAGSAAGQLAGMAIPSPNLLMAAILLSLIAVLLVLVGRPLEDQGISAPVILIDATASGQRSIDTADTTALEGDAKAQDTPESTAVAKAGAEVERQDAQPAAQRITGEMFLQERIDRLAERFALSPRETEVLRYWARGYSSPYIEKKLFISKSTVKTHLNHIYAKTGTPNREGLIELLQSL